MIKTNHNKNGNTRENTKNYIKNDKIKIRPEQ